MSSQAYYESLCRSGQAYAQIEQADPDGTLSGETCSGWKHFVYVLAPLIILLLRLFPDLGVAVMGRHLIDEVFPGRHNGDTTA